MHSFQIFAAVRKKPVYHCLLTSVRKVNWQPGELSLIYTDDQPHVLQER